MPEFFRPWLPAPQRVCWSEQLRAAFGAALGICLTALLCKAASGFLPVATASWLFAAIGASAVLVFAVPASPFSQPWSVLAGHCVSALAGIVSVLWFGDSAWGAGVAVGLAIAGMFALRCLHPPGGGTALLVVLAHIHRFDFVLFPVLANAVVLVAVGTLYHRLTGQRYPQRSATAPATPSPAPPTLPQQACGSSAADFDGVATHNQPALPVDRADFSALRCADIMSGTPVTAEVDTPLDAAWARLLECNISALPVVDKAGRVVGLCTRDDFMRKAAPTVNAGASRGAVRAEVKAVSAGAQGLKQPEPSIAREQATVVGDIMTRNVRVADHHSRVLDLVARFAENGYRYVPIVNDDTCLVGIVTPSDVVAALHRALRRPQ